MPSCAMPAATPIISCSRMPTLTTRSGCRSRTPAVSKPSTPMSASTSGQPRIVVERIGRDAREALSHAVHGHASTSGDDGVRAARLAGRDRPLERVVVARVGARGRPALEREALRDAVGPAVRGAEVVDDDRGQAVESHPPGERDRLVVRALGELSVAEHAEDARAAAARRRAARARGRRRSAGRGRASRSRSRRPGSARRRGDGRGASRTCRSRRARSTGMKPLAASTA